MAANRGVRRQTRSRKIVTTESGHGADVLGHFLTQGAKLTAVGLGLGLAAALLLTRWLSTLLYGVRPNDPTSFAAAAVLLLAVGLAASYVPTRRAARMDPMAALRSE